MCIFRERERVKRHCCGQGEVQMMTRYRNKY